MSRIMTTIGSLFTGFPRVSGDEPTRAEAEALPDGFSPRERG